MIAPHPRRASNVALYAILVAGSLAFLVPFYFLINGSLKTNAQVQAGNFISPPTKLSDVQWSNYPDALAPDRMNFWPALANTVVITTLCIAGQIISCSLVGFGFARFRFRGRSILFMIMLSTMMLPAQVTMIPVFILFRWLHMIDTFWPLVIPAWLASPFFVFMFRQFFSQIPEELIEAARIDGAGNARIYWQLMLPLSGPVIAIVAIYTFLGTWNDFMGPLIYLDSPQNRTLTLALNGFKGQFGNLEAHHLMAASVVCMMPCIILFFAAQRYFVQSVAMTGLKA
ncbi:MAG TPA: carbohydrate ABC transporter permease [Tepidisphaeraceae bacterium]|nr:carbohydrate ABC transporter permease [Tepidisphaeraceae bacterium]